MRLRLLFEWCAVVAVTLAIVAMLLVNRTTERLDNLLYDVLVGYAAPPVSDRILLVAIDDTSVAAIGRWPWPRGIHARLLEQIAKADPAAVAYDVLFTEPASAEQDRRLGRAMQGLGNVALPVLFQAPGRNGSPIDAIPPIEPIATAARAIGEVALIPDGEGVARSVPVVFTADGREWPHLMEVAYRITTGSTSPVYRQLVARGEAFATIPFQPESGHFQTVSFVSVLNGEVPSEFMKDRILLIGVTATGLGDRFRVPTRTGAMISGIEVQANLLNSLLKNRVVASPGETISLIAAMLPTLALMISFWWLRPSRAFWTSVAMIGLILIVPLALLLLFDIWLAPTPALAGLLVAYPLWGWRRLQAVDRAISEELTAFSRDDAPATAAASPRDYLDPIGGQTARLRSAISGMRDLRRLVSDTVDGVNDPILVTDLDDRTILANAAARDLLGQAVEGSTSTRLIEGLEGRNIAADAGSAEIWLDNGKVYAPRRFPLCNHAGEQRGWIAHLVDISTIRMAQRDREEALEFLSHDMRSPQSSIITLLEQHRHTIPDRALVDRIDALARKTLRLSDDFVQMARFSVASFDPEDINLADVLTEAADELWPLASRRDVRIAIEGAEGPFFMQGERDTLSRALINLLDNAVKFSPAGSVVHCAIRFDSDETIECTIEDAGPGIQAERRRDLFARFGPRRDAAGSRVSSGLGLAYVGAAVKRHGGSINCEARAPRGTRFVLRFPASK